MTPLLCCELKRPSQGGVRPAGHRPLYKRSWKMKDLHLLFLHLFWRHSPIKAKLSLLGQFLLGIHELNKIGYFWIFIGPLLYHVDGKIVIKSKIVSVSKNTLSQRSSIKMHLNHVKYCDSIFLFWSQVLFKILWRKSQNLKKPTMSNQKMIIPFKIIFV